MTKLLTLAVVASLAPLSALAQTSAPTFTGPHVTVMGGWNQGQDEDVLAGTGDKRENQSSVVARAAVGYDAPIGDIAIIGAEIGIASGGKDIITRSGANAYRTDPRIAFDATARIGVKPVENVLLFAKGGWAMQRVRTTLDTPTADITSRDTEHGILFGGGAEFAVTRNVALRADFDRVSYNDHYKRNRLLGGVSVRF